MTRPSPRRVLRRPGRLRALAVVLSAAFVLAGAAPADAAPLLITPTAGPVRDALGPALVVHDDFDTDRSTLDGAPAQAPAGVSWTRTGGASWAAAAGTAAVTSGLTGALTVPGTVAAVDVTALLQAPAVVAGLLNLGEVRYGAVAQSGGAGRLEGGMRCRTVLLQLALTQTCTITLWSVVGGTASPLCDVISYTAGSGTPARVRLVTTGASATFSVIGSASCTATVPVALRAQTGVGVFVDSSVALSVLGTPALVLQITAVRADRVRTP